MLSFKALRTKTVIKKKLKKKKNSIISLLPYFNGLSSFSCCHFCFVVFYLFVLSFLSFFFAFRLLLLTFLFAKEYHTKYISLDNVQRSWGHANPTIIIEYRWIPEKRAAFSKTVLSGTVLASGNFNLTSKNLRSREKAPLQFCRQWSYFLV